MSCIVDTWPLKLAIFDVDGTLTDRLRAAFGTELPSAREPR